MRKPKNETGGLCMSGRHRIDTQLGVERRCPQCRCESKRDHYHSPGPAFERVKRKLRASNPAIDFRAVLKKDPCAYCGASPAGTVDHIVPQSEGGEDDAANWTGSCGECNNFKQSLSLLEALPWIPAARDYHTQRRRLFGGGVA